MPQKRWRRKISVSELFSTFIVEREQQASDAGHPPKEIIGAIRPTENSESSTGKVPNAKTIDAMKEARTLAHSDIGKSFSGIKDLTDDLNS